jgi:hypothetical protein
VQFCSVCVRGGLSYLGNMVEGSQRNTGGHQLCDYKVIKIKEQQSFIRCTVIILITLVIK